MKILNMVVLCFLTPAFPAFGQELQENFVPVRALGMGGAFTAVANDESAVWTNPAGVARARKHRTRDFLVSKFPNIGIGVNERTKGLYQSIVGNKDKSVAEVAQESTDLGSNQSYYANLHAYPSVLFDYDDQLPGAIGIFTNNTTNLYIDKDVPEQARSTIISDSGGVFNVNWTNRTNRLTLGFQVRYVVRYAYEDIVPTNDLKNKSELQKRIQDNANQSQGVGLDFGFMYTFADFWFPTFGLAVLNLPTGCKENYLNPFTEKRETVCGNVYHGDIENEDALSVVDPTDIRVGLSISPRLARNFTMRIAFDAHHMWLDSGDQVIGMSGIDAQKMFHAGIELLPGNPLERPPFSIRLGLNQGFVTGGASLNLPYFSLDIATYGVDVAGGSKRVEDRRYLASLGVTF